MLIILIIILALLILSWFFTSFLGWRTQKRSLDKLSPYECGLEPIGNTKIRFKIIYYLIGILYLLFDLEIIFFYPLATSLWLLNSYIAFISLIFFLFVLTISFIYEWFQGALD